MTFEFAQGAWLSLLVENEPNLLGSEVKYG
jgi:hypothetical protein